MTWQLSKHAKARALDMALLPHQIRNVLTAPRRVRPPNANHPGKELYERGEIAAVVTLPDEDGARTVITFLYRHRTGWEDDARFPAPKGRRRPKVRSLS